ncbi:MAG: (2Fe-2S)-binding protein [Desulfocucumaceae bacterium]
MLRIEDRGGPGSTESLKEVEFTFNGRQLAGLQGEPIAAALLANGLRTLRHHEKSGRPRGIYCGIGHCYECRVTVNGVPGMRACLTPLEGGMAITSESPGREAAGSEN